MLCSPCQSSRVDIDAYVASHRDQWERLDELVRRRRLDGGEVDELVGLYRSTAQHLSRVRTGAPDPQVVAELSTRLARARGRITGTRETRLAALTHFLAVTMPAALYRVRWWTVGVMVASVTVAVITAVWTLRSPEAMAALGTPTDLDRYAHESFEAYYSTYSHQAFAAQVWTNNARVAAICVASGITGFLPVMILGTNAVSVGQAAAVMADHGMLREFFALILPHGLLELTCVFVAGGAGLRLFWTMLVPGPVSRGTALARAGRTLGTVAVAMALALGLSGIIEGFVTPSALPWTAKIVIGVLALAVLWAYTIVLGRRAMEAEDDGDLPDDEAGYLSPEAG